MKIQGIPSGSTVAVGTLPAGTAFVVNAAIPGWSPGDVGVMTNVAPVTNNYTAIRATDGNQGQLNGSTQVTQILNAAVEF